MSNESRRSGKKQCMLCGKKDGSLNKCKSCYERYQIRKYYCSKACQMQDWEDHKDFHRMCALLFNNPTVRESLDIPDSITLEEAVRDAQVKMSTPLVKYASFGDVKGVQKILLSAAQGDVPEDAVIHRAVGFAIRENQPEIVKLLIKAFGNRVIFKRAFHGGTILHQACQFGHLEIAEHLISVGGKALLHGVLPNGWTALHTSCAYGHLDLVKTFLALGDDTLLFKVCKQGNTCLHVACQNGHADIVRALITAGGQKLLMVIQSHDMTCLHAACKAGHAKIAKLLIEAGGAELLHHKGGENATCLHLASLLGSAETVRMLVDAGGMDLMLQRISSDNSTCLHLACMHNQVEVADYLIRKGGEKLIMALDSNGLSCLHLACVKGHMDLVHALIRTAPGRRLARMRNEQGYTAMHLLEKDKRPGVLTFLQLLSAMDPSDEACH